MDKLQNEGNKVILHFVSKMQIHCDRKDKEDFVNWHHDSHNKIC